MIIKKMSYEKGTFTTLPTETLCDKISFGAKGVWAYLMTKPKDWIVRIADLEAVSGESAGAVRKYLKELETSGVAVLKPVIVNRRMSGKEWILFDCKESNTDIDISRRSQITNVEKVEVRESRSSENTDVREKSIYSNTGLISNNELISNTDLLQKEKSENLQFSPTLPQEKIEVEKIEKPKTKRKKMETTNEPKDYTEVLKNATQSFLDLDDELIELWNILNNEKTWKGKSDHARKLQANSLVDFTPEFIKHRLKITISGGKEGAYPSIVYGNTHKDFEDFIKNQQTQKRNTGGLNRETWDKEIASGTYGTTADYEKAVKYYEAVKNNLPKNVKLQMFNEKELCTLFALMQNETKAQKIKEAYRTIVANPEKYNHHELLFEAIKEIIFN